MQVTVAERNEFFSMESDCMGGRGGVCKGCKSWEVRREANKKEDIAT